MPALLFLLRAVFLVVLWGLVLAAVLAVRRDVWGTKAQTAGRARAAAPPAPAKAGRDRPARSAASVARRLVVTDGPLAGTSLPLGQAPVTIGRADDSTLVVSDDYVSTRHARLVPSESAWVLEDLGSTNGTYLDRTKVTAPTPVPVGVPIRIGKTVMELRR